MPGIHWGCHGRRASVVGQVRPHVRLSGGNHEQGTTIESRSRSIHRAFKKGEEGGRKGGGGAAVVWGLDVIPGTQSPGTLSARLARTFHFILASVLF